MCTESGNCLVILRGGRILAILEFWPPTHIREMFLKGKMKFTEEAGKWRLTLGAQTFLWP